MKIKFLASVLVLSLFMVSCNDDDEGTDPTPPADTSAEIMLAFEYKFGSNSFELDTYYTTATGENVKFSLATFYIAKPTLMDDAENMFPLNPEYIIVRPGQMMTSFGEMEEGHVHELMYSLGIDEASNTQDGATGVQPTDFSADHPLAPQPEGMHWSWNSGYIFAKFEGEVDYDKDGTADSTFAYHLGTNAMRRDKMEVLHADIEGGEDFMMEMAIDMGAIFNNVDLNTERSTHSMGDGEALAEKIMDNFSSGVNVSVHDAHEH